MAKKNPVHQFTLVGESDTVCGHSNHLHISVEACRNQQVVNTLISQQLAVKIVNEQLSRLSVGFMVSLSSLTAVLSRLQTV